MVREIRVLVIEDDPYARDMMAMMLARDWRTRVVAELGSGSEREIKELFKQPNHHIDLVIIDTEIPVDPHWPMRAAELVLQAQPRPAILYTCTRPDPANLERLPRTPNGGYIIKGEVLYSLASAVSLIIAGNWVTSPGVQKLGEQAHLPEGALLVNGDKPAIHFTHREMDLLRLAILFNLSQRDISDELIVSTDFVSEVMGQLYDKIGLHEILAGDVSLEEYFSDETVLARARSILKRSPGNPQGIALRKAPWMATLAFHLLTVPRVEKI